eukprot:Skav215531  [mRNA]  locus=scaffold219:272526:273896:+ [translate_table: standard]
MAVISSMPAPPKPTSLDVDVRPDKSLVIRWDGAKGECYELEVRYFEFGGPMIEPECSIVITRRALAAHVLHPEELSKLKGWVVKVGLRAKIENGLFSDAVIKQAAWDDELSTEETEADLQKRTHGLRLKELQEFVNVKNEMPNFLVLGGDHHGKSSLVNHLYRCFKCDVSIDDQMEVATRGMAEKGIKHVAVPLSTSDSCISCIHVINTPEFTPFFVNKSEAARRLRAFCSSGLLETSRQTLGGRAFSKPHGAIVIMSLCHWRDENDEMKSYLQKMAETFKAASGGKVAFPYVVVCTHRDVYLMECQKDDPAKELQKAADEIKRAASTEDVYSITNYRRDDPASARNNMATFDFVSQLLILAKSHTAKRQDIWWHLWLCLGIVLLLLAPVFGVMILLILLVASGKNEKTMTNFFHLEWKWAFWVILAMLCSTSVIDGPVMISCIISPSILHRLCIY